MSSPNIEYQLIIGDSNYFDTIFNLLKDTDQDFIPSITSKFFLEDITKKYIDRACLYIAYFDSIPAGFVSFYVNEYPNNSYLSLIAVKSEFRGYEIGKNLELNCIEYCRKKKSKGLNVNMRKSNDRLYRSRIKLGYIVTKEYKLEYSDELIVDMYLEF
ncbi:GNAT family N-acetyltransferase [Empedobacter brevis]|uniref:GNAT family N-acetyltransferase n=1 Tax=Empedobacter brevis TaxID=247 RepID=UPI0039AFF358